jgi:hypothetical protein
MIGDGNVGNYLIFNGGQHIVSQIKIDFNGAANKFLRN